MAVAPVLRRVQEENQGAGPEFTDGEIRRLFDHFDKQRTGSIDFEEFLQSLRNPLNEEESPWSRLLSTPWTQTGLVSWTPS